MSPPCNPKTTTRTRSRIAQPQRAGNHFQHEQEADDPEREIAAQPCPSRGERDGGEQASRESEQEQGDPRVQARGRGETGSDHELDHGTTVGVGAAGAPPIARRSLSGACLRVEKPTDRTVCTDGLQYSSRSYIFVGGAVRGSAVGTMGKSSGELWGLDAQRLRRAHRTRDVRDLGI